MAEEKETQEKTPTQEETTTQEAPTTLEEQLESVKTQLAEATQKRDEFEKGLRTAHQTLQGRDRQLKRYESEGANIDALSARVEVLGGMVSEIVERDNEEEPKKVDYAEKFREAEKNATLKSQIAMRQRRAEATGIPMNDPRIGTIEYLATGGRFGEADKFLEELEAKQKEEPKEEGPKETEAERIERLAEEKALKKMEEKGLLHTETGRPSAISGSFAEFEKAYIEGKVPPEDYEARARKEGKL